MRVHSTQKNLEHNDTTIFITQHAIAPLAHQHAALLQQLVQVDGEQLKGDAEVATEGDGPERQDHAGARSLEEGRGGGGGGVMGLRGEPDR